MQNWSNLLEQGCLDQFGGNTECDYVITSGHIPSAGSTMAVDCCIDVLQNTDEDISSKRQLR